MGKVGDDVYSTEDAERVFVGPDVDRYERQDGGEVIVVTHSHDESETDASTDKREE